MGHCSFTSPKGMGAEGVGSAEKGNVLRDPLYLKIMLLSPRDWFLWASQHIRLFASRIRVLLGPEISWNLEFLFCHTKFWNHLLLWCWALEELFLSYEQHLLGLSYVKLAWRSAGHAARACLCCGAWCFGLVFWWGHCIVWFWFCVCFFFKASW